MEITPDNDDLQRRAFLKTAGAGVPTLRLMAASMAAPAEAAPYDDAKFTPLDIGRFYSASPADFGPRKQASFFSRDGLIHAPAGTREFRGIPFLLGADGAKSKRWLVLSTRSSAWTLAHAEFPVGRKSSHICVAQFCDWDPDDGQARAPENPKKAGQLLAEAVLVYEDGSEKACPIRRRLEVCEPSTPWGQRALLALAHPPMIPRNLADPLVRGTDWGALQTVVKEDGGVPMLWVCALPNPRPDQVIRTLRLRAASADLLAVCGVTLYHGKENPLRYERLSVYRIALPEARAEEQDRWEVTVDLGVVARTRVLPDFDPEAWLGSPGAGLGGFGEQVKAGRYLYAEVTASPDATLALRDTKTGRRYLFDLNQAVKGRDVAARTGGSQVRLLERDKAWLHARVVDPATGKPVPVRLAFRSKEGRYIPPYGHRADINAAWFQDYGADVKMGADSFAYVDGEFEVELPLGEVHVEIAKGFEYAPVRRKLRIEPGQRSLNLEISKYADLRAQGWVSADTHVHFLSPSTAILEGQAEGLNLINLLAAQWGDLYTSMGDLAHGPLTSRDKEMVVWPGTENRNHLMGHIGLLGAHGSPVLPLSAGFPYGADESYPGDPVWMSMSEWADQCRQREGLTVAVHFPNPLAEIVADIVLGKIDAVEVPARPFNEENYVEWYRYLNCGYRLPIAGGTDKMSAGTAVGRSRTYANLGPNEFNFANWAKAVRKGNTFATTGPLLLLRVDGRVPGGEIPLGSGGGTVEVEAHARCFTPIHSVEIVVNGRVVTSREEKRGARELVLREKIPVSAPAWIAARCESQSAPGVRWPRVGAHTSPVYLTVPGRELFSAPIASYFMAMIDGTQSWFETIATRADPERYEKVRKVYVNARAELQKRINAHGSKA